jgi:hypothetical protein
LIFGFPVKEASRAARDGRLALGGCIMPNNEPRIGNASNITDGAMDARTTGRR